METTEQKIKVVIISPFMYRLMRGIERFTLDLAEGLARRGVQVHIITWKEGGQWPWPKMNPAIHLHGLRLPRYFARFFASIAYAILLRRIRPDSIFIHFTWHGEEKALRYTPNMIPRTCLVLHYPRSLVPYRYESLYRSAVFGRLHIAAVSQYVARECREADRKRITVIPNGIDTEAFMPVKDASEARRRLGLRHDALTLVSVAALEKRKGHFAVMEAVAMIKNRYPDLFYLIAGEGEEMPNLKKTAERLSIERNVIFLGNVQNVQDVYHAADIFVSISRGEAVGLNILEAMACGLPLLIASEPPMDEFADESCACFVPWGDAKAAARMLGTLLENPALRSRMGKSSRLNAVQRHDKEKMLDSYHELTQEISAGTRYE